MRINRFRKKQVAPVLIFIMLVFSCLTVSAPAQEVRQISMDFQGASLKDVLKIFSQQAGLNFVASSEIEDKEVTLYLEGVSVQDALDSIMKANNLAYDQAPGSSVFIVRESGKQKINLITKVYTLNFARVVIREEKEGSSGGASGSSGNSDIKMVLESLLTKAESGDLLGGIVVDERTNSIIITSIPEDFTVIEETIKTLDAPTQQALIEAEIVEVATDDLKKLGLTWGNQATGTFVSFSGPTRTTKFPFIRTRAPFSEGLLTGVDDSNTLGTLSLSEFSVVLRALEIEGKVRYLAKPRLMVLDNETAEIKIASDTAVGLKSTSQTDTGTIVEEAERVETGVILKVTPTINKDGYITMTLEPEVSRAVASNITTSTGVRLFDPARRNVRTTIMVKDGQSIAIGGLLKSDDTDAFSKTPGLSRIPFLGHLFKNDDVRHQTTEIIIFITAHVVKDSGPDGQSLVEIAVPPAAGAQAEEAPVAVHEEAEEGVAAKRATEIKKTVIKLRKKRELSR